MVDSVDKDLAAGLPPVTDTEDALAAVVALRRLADRLELESVQYASSQGWTWAEIAESLGVSKQAVHKRYAKRINLERSKGED